MLIRILTTPIAKGRPRMTRTDHAYTPERTRDYENEIALGMKASMGAIPPLSGPVHLRLRFVFQRPKALKIRPDEQILHTKKPDLDNLCKAVLDAANGILWADDTQVVELEASKCYGYVGEQAQVQIYVEGISANEECRG